MRARIVITYPLDGEGEYIIENPWVEVGSSDGDDPRLAELELAARSGQDRNKAATYEVHFDQINKGRNR